MNTLSYGYQQPTNSDTSDVWMPALAADIAQLNNHNHDGITSAPLATQSANISSGAWTAAAIGGGLYQQTITLPTGLSYDTCQIWFKLATGEYIFPTVTRVSTTQFIVYCNDNSKTLVAYYR
jgi:hypothetical protein